MEVTVHTLQYILLIKIQVYILQYMLLIKIQMYKIQQQAYLFKNYCTVRTRKTRN